MLVIAHAGHWLVQLIYLVPLAVLVGVILAGRRRDRREAAHEQVREAGRRVRIDGRRRGVPARAMSRDELFVLWSAARAEANMAYDAWCEAPGRIAYAVYRAAEDRADAAEVALSESARRRSSPPDRGHRHNHGATRAYRRVRPGRGPVTDPT